MPGKKPKRSAFDALPTTPPPEAAEVPVPHLGPAGTAGLRLAGEKKRPRSWEREHQYGKGYSVKGVRPDINLWLLDTAEDLGVRVAEVAVYALMHSMKLVDSGKLGVKVSPKSRGALMTLFPSGYDESGGEDVQVAIQKLTGRSRAAKEKARKSKGKPKANWKSKTVNWTPFDQDLKDRIIEHCRDCVPQGEFITFLLERARADHQAGLLTFNPQPKVAVNEQIE